jgi:hypothetical protein
MFQDVPSTFQVPFLILFSLETDHWAIACTMSLAMSEALAYINDVGGRLVALAGANHVWRDAIPERFERQAARGAWSHEGNIGKQCNAWCFVGKALDSR